MRVIGRDADYAEVFDQAFNEIRQIGATHPAVVIHLLGAIERIAEHVRTPEQREALLHCLALISKAGLNKAEQQRDRGDIQEKHAAAERKLRGVLKGRLAAVPADS